MNEFKILKTHKTILVYSKSHNTIQEVDCEYRSTISKNENNLFKKYRYIKLYDNRPLINTYKNYNSEFNYIDIGKDLLFSNQDDLQIYLDTIIDEV